MPIDSQTSRAAQLFLERVRDRYPAADAVLFGSRARGDFHAESDADVAVVLPGVLVSRSATAGIMADMAFDVLLETGVLISALPMSANEFSAPATFGNPDLVRTIHREGIRL
jgi:predicted nucleotidyltransferase